MTIGSITPMSSLMADLGSVGATTAPGAASDANPSLFMALLQDELQTVAAALESADDQAGAGAAAGSAGGTLAAATEAASTTAASTTAAGTTSSGTTSSGTTSAATNSAATNSGATQAAASASAAPVATPPAGTSATSTTAAVGTTSAGSTTPGSASAAVSKPEHEYVVLYVHGQTPVSIGPTPAPLVRGPTGKLVLTAKTTGLTQLTPRFSGTVADPTAAAQATATVMATIARLKARGQA